VRSASDRKLVGTAPTTIAVEDEFMLWLWHQAGTVDPDIDIAY
jgi:hypothetical protein